LTLGEKEIAILEDMVSRLSAQMAEVMERLERLGGEK